MRVEPKKAPMACDHASIRVNQYRSVEPELCGRRRNLSDVRIGVRSRVIDIRNEPVEFPNSMGWAKGREYIGHHPSD